MFTCFVCKADKNADNVFIRNQVSNIWEMIYRSLSEQKSTSTSLSLSYLNIKYAAKHTLSCYFTMYF